MRVGEFDHVDAFTAACGPFLLRREREHVALLGLVESLRHEPPSETAACDLVAAFDGAQPVAAALGLRTEQLVLSTGPPAALSALADHATEQRDPPTAVLGPAAAVVWFADRWQDRTGERLRTVGAHRVYACDRPDPPADVPGAMRPATSGDREYLTAFGDAFAAEAGSDGKGDGAAFADRVVGPRPDGRLYVWEAAGRPVAMANTSQPTPGTMTVSSVYTEPGQRRCGIAGALTAAVAAEILAAGKRSACLFLDLAGPASDGAYTRVGYRPVGDALRLRAAGTR